MASVFEFAETQKTHFIKYPPLAKRKTSEGSVKSIPFVKLLDGNESFDNVERRWELYHQLHSYFHSQVDNIIANIESDLKADIRKVLFPENQTVENRNCFKTLFLLGSDGTTTIELPDNNSGTFNSIVSLTAKESPNVRMMLKRSMFKLYTDVGHDQAKKLNKIKYEEFDNVDEQLENESKKMDNGNINDENDNDVNADVSYDMNLVANFKKVFGKNLHLIFNFKDVDSFNFVDLDDFILLLKSALNHEHVKISLVFNINTNLSNIEKQFRQPTIRLFKKDFSKLDVASSGCFKYSNRIFQSFLDTVDGKLNLSSKFVKFILEKMANNTNQNLQLLTTILDYSLMTYFYETPFSVFIDPVNVEVLDDSYLKILTKCPTFMLFIDGLIRQNAPSEEVLDLLSNKDKSLEEFFVDFLVRENPINGHAKYVSNYLQENLNIKNFNLVELYEKLLTGDLNDYLTRWSLSDEDLKLLGFEPIDTIFQELFTLDNSNKLLSQALLPNYKTNIEDGLLNWETVLPHTELNSEGVNIETLETLIGPTTSQLFQLYREANTYFNIQDFYVAFEQSLPKNLLFDHLNARSESSEELAKFIRNNDEETVVDKVTFVLFMHALVEFEQMGLVRPQSTKSYSVWEKCIWKGI